MKLPVLSVVMVAYHRITSYNVCYTKLLRGPVAIEQFNQLNSATLSALPAIGVTSSEGLDAIRQAAAQIMPSGFFEDFIGESRLSRQEGNTLAP